VACSDPGISSRSFTVLIFINDLEDDIVTVILKFADDTKIFRKVTNATYGLWLQQDLNRLCDWADKWQMEFILQSVRPCILAVEVLIIIIV